MSSNGPTPAVQAVTSAAAVANEFIKLGREEPFFPPIDQMKLQKLLFYAHAWHLAYKGTPLFEEDFEAWPWGPVVRDVYYQTKNYGRSVITGELSNLQRTGDGPLDYSFATPSIQDPDISKFIRNVWNVHKKFTGVQLSNATHAPGEPWSIVLEQYGSLDGKPTIPNKLIMDVFRQKVKNVQ
jgi:uncharacterized phage-associated protein